LRTALLTRTVVSVKGGVADAVVAEERRREKW
jgi:hypothetical protein